MDNADSFTFPLEWRDSDESEADYYHSYANIVQYANGALHDIDAICNVQYLLAVQGYGLSNCIVTAVGPLL